MLINEMMTYQYPSPGTPPPPYNTGYPVAPHMTGMAMRSPDQPGRNDSPTLSFDLKRATSHPNIKVDPESEDPNMATAPEKKPQKKLGYHRASAACTCCRHRKIRCQPGSNGQKKCNMCEKLNKECKFESVSVNSGSPTESRHASMSRASAGNRLTSASSSSSSAHTIDIHAAQHRGSMAMPPIHQMGLSEPPGLKMDACVRYPDYGSQGMATNWMAPDSAGSSSRSKHGSWGPYGHDTTPITPNFPSYTHHQHQHHHSTTSPPPGQAQAQGWGAAPEPSAAGWGSPYPAPTQPFSPMSQMATPTTGGSGYDPKPPSASMPAAEMYPPIPSMTPTEQQQQQQQQHGGAPPLSPPQGSAQPASGYGAWHQQQQQQSAYPPVKQEAYIKHESAYPAVGAWGYSQAEARHGGQSALAHGMPSTHGYYN